MDVSALWYIYKERLGWNCKWNVYKKEIFYPRVQQNRNVDYFPFQHEINYGIMSHIKRKNYLSS